MSVLLTVDSNAIQERVWSTFHARILESSLRREFVSFFPASNEPPPILYSHLIFELLRLSLVKASSAVQIKEQELDTKLTAREEQVLRFVAGFIPYSIKRTYKKMKGKDADLILQVIAMWHAPSDDKTTAESFLNYTRKWTEEINRGGLFLVNDEFYIFVRRLENVVRSVFNAKLIASYQGEDLRDVISSKVSESKLVHDAWETLTRNIDNAQLVDSLFELIVLRWTNIRANAFANAWLDILKAKYKDIASGKAQPSMRKCLK